MPVTTRQKGSFGESIALKYLIEQYYVLHRKNYRYRRCEIDLILEFNKTLVFVEVKLRENNQFGYPEDFFSESQADRIRMAAENYIEEQNWQGPIRFDMIAIEIDNGKKTITHFQDAF